MNIEQRVREFLEERGLFGGQTDSVVDKLKALPPFSNLHFSDDESGYPKAMMAAVLLSARNCAIEWIDAECPGHFARSILETDGSPA